MRASRWAALKQLDANGGTVLLRSFFEGQFSGVRVGWWLAPSRCSTGCAMPKGRAADR